MRWETVDESDVGVLSTVWQEQLLCNSLRRMFAMRTCPQRG